jgi:cyclophilin family peptidyl-prolyl cis-trans isomerase
MFHRIIGNFMIQGGGFDLKYHKKEVHDPIKIESDNGLKNERGTIAMARTNVPDSATSQFFINVVDNDMLDFTKPTTRGYGYAVFGQVLEGMDTVDKIKETKTRRFSTFRNAPEKDIFINAVTVLEDDALKAFKTKLKKTN